MMNLPAILERRFRPPPLKRLLRRFPKMDLFSTISWPTHASSASISSWETSWSNSSKTSLDNSVKLVISPLWKKISFDYIFEILTHFRLMRNFDSFSVPDFDRWKVASKKSVNRKCSTVHSVSRVFLELFPVFILEFILTLLFDRKKFLRWFSHGVLYMESFFVHFDQCQLWIPKRADFYCQSNKNTPFWHKSLSKLPSKVVLVAFPARSLNMPQVISITCMWLL